MLSASIWPCSTKRRSAARRRAQVHRDRRSGLSLDGREWRARLLRLLGQLSDRPGSRRDRRRGGDHVGEAGRGDRRQADDRAHPGALWGLARAPGGLRWYGDAANLAWLAEKKGIAP